MCSLRSPSLSWNTAYIGPKLRTGAKARDYLDTVFVAIPVESFSEEMAQIAARVDADARRAGKVIPFSDLLIGATALHHGYAVGTRNLRHFRMIPDLPVLSF